MKANGANIVTKAASISINKEQNLDAILPVAVGVNFGVNLSAEVQTLLATPVLAPVVVQVVGVVHYNNPIEESKE